MKHFIYLLCLLFIPQSSFSQGSDILWHCHHLGDLGRYDLEPRPLSSFGSSQISFDEVHDTVSSIFTRLSTSMGLKYSGLQLTTGLAPNFTALIRQTAKGKVPEIMYNPYYARELLTQGGTWALYGAIVHEFAHHLRGHTHLGSSEREVRHDQELQADYQAGFFLGKMCLSLEQAQACLVLAGDQSTETHPARYQRLAKIDEGWNDGYRGADCREMPDNMVFVKGGTFMMGCTSEQKECNSDESPHRVSLSDYYMSRYELTFREYDAYCNATGEKKPHDEGWGRGDRPVINISWYDAIEYCNWRSQQEGLKPCYEIYKDREDSNNKSTSGTKKWLVSCDFGANGYRLPTESEWEYAARGGKQVLFGNGKNVANPSEMNSHTYSLEAIYRDKTVAVSSFSPNELGLYNMSGNVREWCWDWYCDYSSASEMNPTGASSGSCRVLRGWSWRYNAESVRVAYRDCGSPAFSTPNRGFRLTRTSP